jgi:hypothetical protein
VKPPNDGALVWCSSVRPCYLVGRPAWIVSAAFVVPRRRHEAFRGRSRLGRFARPPGPPLSTSRRAIWRADASAYDVAKSLWNRHFLRDASDYIHLCIQRTSHILPLWEDEALCNQLIAQGKPKVVVRIVPPSRDSPTRAHFSLRHFRTLGEDTDALASGSVSRNVDSGKTHRRAAPCLSVMQI